MKGLTRGIGCTLALSMFMTAAIPQGLQASTQVDYKMNVEDHSKLIESVFNKFRYDMTVEWDQKDPYFKENAQKELEDSLLNLKKRGVSEEQIQNYMMKNMLSEAAKKDYENLLTTIKKQGLSEEEAAEQVMNFMAKNYKEGVGFSGGASGGYSRLGVLVGVIIVGVVAYIIIKKHHNNEEVPQEEEEVTTSETDTSTEETTYGGHHPKPRKPKKGGHGGYSGWGYNPV